MSVLKARQVLPDPRDPRDLRENKVPKALAREASAVNEEEKVHKGNLDSEVVSAPGGLKGLPGHPGPPAKQDWPGQEDLLVVSDPQARRDHQASLGLLGKV